jgi:hypothetical protein
MANEIKAKLYFENTLTPSVVANTGSYPGTWQYNGPGKAINSGGGFFSNVYILTKDNYLYYEKRKTATQSNLSWDIRGSVNVSTAATYSNFGIIMGHLDWVVSPVTADRTYLEKTNGISIGFTSNNYPTAIQITFEFVLDNNRTGTVTNYTSIYTNNSSLFSVNFYDNLTIRNYYNTGYILKKVIINFNNWFANLIPAVTFVAPYLIKEYTFDNGLLGFKKGTESTTDNSLPTYGIIPSYGELKIYDKQQEMEQFGDWGVFKSRIKVKLYIEDNFSIQLLVDDFNYDQQAKIITFNLTDDLLDLQQTRFKGSVKTITSRTLDWVFLNVFRQTTIDPLVMINPLFYNATRTAALVGAMTGTTISSFYLEESSSWDAANKFLRACGAVMWKSPEENAQASTGYILRQVLQLSEVIVPITTFRYVTIPPERIIEGPTKTFINKNYINGVEYDLRTLILSSDPTILETSVLLWNFKTNSNVQSSDTNLRDFTFLNSLLSYGEGNVPDTGLQTPIQPFVDEAVSTSQTTFEDWGFPVFYTSPAAASFNILQNPNIGSTVSYITSPLKAEPQKLIKPADLSLFNGTIKYQRIRAYRQISVGWNKNFAYLESTVYSATSVTETILPNGKIQFAYSFPTADRRTMYAFADTQAFVPPSGPLLFYAVPPVLEVSFVPQLNIKMTGPSYEVKTVKTLVGEERNVYTLETNELMMQDSLNLNVPIATRLVNSILGNYNIGRETAELTCLNPSVDYLYYQTLDGGATTTIFYTNLGRSFRPGLTVIPQVMKNGVVQPLSKNSDGTPKRYTLTNVEFEHYGRAIVRLKMIQEGPAAFQ